MKNYITPRYLSLYWEDLTSHWVALAPFFAVHAAHKALENGGKRDEWGWVWSKNAVLKCMGACWTMTGSWGARRAKTFDRDELEMVALVEVPKLSHYFNKKRIGCLRDIARLNKSKIEKICDKICESIIKISCIRDTKLIQPVLGSKVLHHFFPSIVPVFDEQYINNGVMKIKEVQSFSDDRADLSTKYGDAKHSRIRIYETYIQCCIEQIKHVSNKKLTRVRDSFFDSFSYLVPQILCDSKRYYVWKMDAKIAEYCLISKAHEDGYF